MKTVLCYGDSNTWGYDPSTRGRYDIHTRWAGVLRDQLGAGWWVIEEGLNGRTTVHDDSLEPGRNGMTYLLPCLLTHKPLDLVIIMLGTNDLKKRFDLPASDIALGAQLLAHAVMTSEAGHNDQPPPVLMICPPPVLPVDNTRFVGMFEGAEAKSKRLAPLYKLCAEEIGCHFFNAGEVVVSSPADAIHWEADQHRKMGEAVARYVVQHFGS